MKLPGVRERGIHFVVAGVVTALVLAAATPRSSAKRSETPFAKVQLFIEYNSTDDDAGIQAFLDGEAWKKVKIVSPGGRTIFEVTGQRSLGEVGLTELRFESAEPSLQRILAGFPAGAYKFEGETIEGKELAGTAMLSRSIPAAPTMLSPAGGGVDRNNAVIQWRHTGGVEGFQVIVEHEELGVMMTVDLPASSRKLRIPSEFLRAKTAYKFEVLAVAANGNRTITESTFTTR